MKKFIISFVFICISLSLGFSQKKLPDWVTTPVFKKGGDVYYVGMGIDKDLVEARKKANEDVTSRIIETILVDVISSTGSETVITSQDGKIDVSETVKRDILTQGKARIFIPVPEEEFSYQDKNGSYIVYILVKFPESKILEERKRIEQMYRDMIRSVDKFLEEGDKFAREGKLVNSILSYTLAAKNALSVEERRMFYPEIIKKIEDILSRLSIEVIDGNGKQVGVGDSGEIRFGVFYNLEGKKIPVRDVNVIFRVSSGGAEINNSGTTDENGIVVCNISRVLRFDNRKLSVRAFLNIDFSPLVLLGAEARKDASRLISKARLIQSEANWFMSQSKSKLATVVVLEEKGNKYSYNQSISSSLSSYVMKKGYKVLSVSSISISSSEFEQIKKYLPKDALLVLVKISEPSEKKIEWGNSYETRFETTINIEVYDSNGNLINSDNYRLSNSSLNSLRANIVKNIGEKIEEIEF